jgi:flagellar hook-associated protein 1 FlgK
MGLFGLFDIGKTALFASQTALSVTSNNIANANTPGYTRQEVVLDIATPRTIGAGMLGRGVVVAGIKRDYEMFIQSQLLGQGQSSGRSAALDQVWGQVEQVFNEMQGLGLQSSLNDFFNAWQEVSIQPEATTTRVSLLQKSIALVSAARRMERSVTDTIKGMNDGITDAVSRVNELATQIASLNGAIVKFEAGGAGTANDLRDQRDHLLNELAGLVEVSSFEDNQGAVSISVGMRSLVSGERTNALSTAVNADGDRTLVLDGTDITERISQGKIGGLLDARSDVESQTLAGLRRLVASIVQRVNAQHRQGFGLDGSTGNDFFAPLQLSVTASASAASVTAAGITNPDLLTLDEYRIGFDGAGNYEVFNKQSGALITSGAYNPGGTAIALPGMSVTVTGATTSSDSFTVSPLATAISGFGVAVTDQAVIAAASAAAGLPGDNSNALSLAGLAGTAQGGLGNITFADYYNGVVSTVGVMARAASDGRAFDENVMAELTARRESVSGVSLDEEAVNLIRYQRSYEAGARMIKVADELIQTVLNL